MKLTLTLFWLILSYTLFYGQEIQNIRSEQVGEKIYIRYDIANATSSDRFEVSVFCRTSPGKEIECKSVSGDVGSNISGGNDKLVVWDVLKDVESLNSAEFIVRASKNNNNTPVTVASKKSKKSKKQTKSASSFFFTYQAGSDGKVFGAQVGWLDLMGRVGLHGGLRFGQGAAINIGSTFRVAGPGKDGFGLYPFINAGINDLEYADYFSGYTYYFYQMEFELAAGLLVKLKHFNFHVGAASSIYSTNYNNRVYTNNGAFLLGLGFSL